MFTSTLTYYCCCQWSIRNVRPHCVNYTGVNTLCVELSRVVLFQRRVGPLAVWPRSHRLTEHQEVSACYCLKL